jgi:hypothetical protein
LDSQVELLRDLHTLTRGPGVHTPDISTRLGPHLRAAWGITANATSTAIRREVTHRLEQLCRELPTELATAALVAFGLHPPAQATFLKYRVRWLASYVDRETRTAQRRIDAAVQSLARDIAVLATAPQHATGQCQCQRERIETEAEEVARGVRFLTVVYGTLDDRADRDLFHQFVTTVRCLADEGQITPHCGRDWWTVRIRPPAEALLAKLEHVAHEFAGRASGHWDIRLAGSAILRNQDANTNAEQRAYEAAAQAIMADWGTNKLSLGELIERWHDDIVSGSVSPGATRSPAGPSQPRSADRG